MLDDLRPYPEYRDSGVPWPGRIPAHWETRRAKYLFREVDDRSITGDEELLSVSHLTGVTPRRQKNVTMFMAESNVGHKMCLPGDLVINTLWAWMAALGVCRDAGIVSPAYGVYRPLASSPLLPEYADLLLRTQMYAAEYTRRSTGIRASRLRLYPEDFLRIPVLTPPPSEQRRIVNFLRAHGQRVAAFIRNRRRLIELLNEQKQAMITQAVTRGLDPSAPMKPSGVSWLGEVPEHWRVPQGRRLISYMTSGSRGWAEFYSDTGDIFLQSGNLGREMSLNLTRIQHVQPPQGSEGERTRVRRNDVLVCITGALTGNVALVDVDLPAPAFVNQHVALIRPDTSAVCPRYLALALHSEVGKVQFKAGEYGGTKQGLGLDDVKGALIPLPPIPEQLAICAALRESLGNLEVARKNAQVEISLVREYRLRLVSDVVTGKVDVRHLAPEQVEEDLEGIEGLGEGDEGDDLDELDDAELSGDGAEVGI